MNRWQVAHHVSGQAPGKAGCGSAAAMPPDRRLRPNAVSSFISNRMPADYCLG